MMNDYNKLYERYSKTHTKPDKRYSMLPTILKLAGPLKNKTAIDVGCGDGFFTFALAKKASKVYGIDNSKKQIQTAQKYTLKNTEFIFFDMFTFNYPHADLINSPFIFGYLKSPQTILKLFKKFYHSLNKNGKLIGVIDAPKSTLHNNKKFGSIKRVRSLHEGAKLKIELYNGKKILALDAYYHTKKTIEQLLNLAGFQDIKWPKPIISEAGKQKFGKIFWKEYLKNIDVSYFIAKKYVKKNKN